MQDTQIQYDIENANAYRLRQITAERRISKARGMIKDQENYIKTKNHIISSTSNYEMQMKFHFWKKIPYIIAKST